MMPENDKAILNEDVYSNFDIQNKFRKPYAKRGDTVTIISESLPAAIVETKNGERFPVNIKKLTIKSK
jgi:hypothetical protein